jgi:AraC-like DNA-binding protein
MDNLANEASGSDNGLVSVSENPEALYSDKRTGLDVTEALEAAIGSLAPEDRLILKLYYFDDLRLKDIAATFGYHEATASRKLVRVQSEIRKAVEKTLKHEHGWSETEVSKYLAEAAEKTGFSFEKMLAVLAIASVLQEIALSGVL